MRRLLQFVFLMMMTQVAWGATHTANSCQYSDVSAAFSSASAGDTILIPGGSCTWSSTLVITKAITVQPVPGQTITITNSVSDGTVFSISNTGSSLVRISGDNGSATNCNPSGACGLIINSPVDPTFTHSVFVATGPVYKLRIDHVRADQSDSFICNNCGGGAAGGVYGVVDHCYISNFGRPYFAQDQRSADGTNGQTAWGEFIGAEASLAGSGKMMYFEDDRFTWTHTLGGGQGQAIFYGQYGGKGVLRYSTMDHWGWGIDAHGDNPEYGAIFYELYNNTFSDANAYLIEGKIMYLRGGQFLIHDNDFNTSAQPIQFTVYNSLDLPAHRVQNSFVWNNRINGVAQTPSIADVETSDGGYPKYYLRAPTTGDVYAGYTPYTYPHPLVTGSGGSGGSGSVQAPTGLTVVTH